MGKSNKEVKKTEQKNSILAWSLILGEVIIIAAIWLIVYFTLR